MTTGIAATATLDEIIEAGRAAKMAEPTLTRRGIAFGKVAIADGAMWEVRRRVDGALICPCKALDADAIAADHECVSEPFGFGTKAVAIAFASAVVRHLEARGKAWTMGDESVALDAEQAAALGSAVAGAHEAGASPEAVSALATAIVAAIVDAPEGAAEEAPALESCPLGCGAAVDLSVEHTCEAPADALSADDLATLARADQAIAQADAIIAQAQRAARDQGVQVPLRPRTVASVAEAPVSTPKAPRAPKAPAAPRGKAALPAAGFQAFRLEKSTRWHATPDARVGSSACDSSADPRVHAGIVTDADLAKVGCPACLKVLRAAAR